MKHVALLRAVNLAGKNRVSMADLRALARDLGLAEPETLLQSGNLVFEGGRRSTATLERMLAEGAEARFGAATEFFVRSATDWDRIVEACPFPQEAEEDPAHLLLGVLKDRVTPRKLDALRAAIRGRERVEGAGREVYVVYPDGMGRSKLTMALLEKHLDTRCTGRNWNTALKLRTRLHA